MKQNLGLYADIEDAYPLSMLQAGMLFHSEARPDSPIYHDIFIYDVSGKYDSKKFRQAIQQLTNRHSVLRTSFNLSEFNEPLQLVHKSVDVQIKEINLCNLTGNSLNEELARYIEIEKKMPFIWSKGQLFRLSVFHVNENKFKLVLSFHHSILDGWSVASMMTELHNTYIEILHNDYYFKEPLKPKFRDFIALERKAVECEKHKRYWNDKLMDSKFTKIHRWPFREDRLNIAYTNSNLIVNGKTYEGLVNLSKSISVPMKSILLAAYLRIISLITGESDVMTGLVSNGRLEEKDGEKVLGLFLNTIPFRIKVTNGTWVDLIKQTFILEQEMLEFRRYPMAQIQMDLKRKELFETAFNYTNFHVYENIITDSKQIIPSIDGVFEQTNFPLSFTISPDKKNNELNIKINYDPNEFCKQQIEMIKEYYLNTLSAIAFNSNSFHTNDSILTQVEKNKLLKDWNGEKISDRNNKNIIDLLEEHAKMNPQNIAAVFEQDVLTYEELNTQANKIARYLRKQGVTNETLVGVYLERSIEFIVSIFGIWKAGCVYVPLDIAYPNERLNFIIEDTELSFIVSNNRLINNIHKTVENVIYVEEEWDKINKEKMENVVSVIDVNNLAYVIYTSGSTGEPKGTLVTHKGLSNVVEECKSTFAITVNDRILQIASPGFDASIFEILMALGNGATIYIAKTNELSPDMNMVGIMEEYGITIITLTPTFLAYLPVKELPKLRIINVVGETCRLETVKHWSKNRKIFNLYGPTEATIWTTKYEYKDDDDRLPIGKAIGNVEVYIMDLNQQLVPTGVPGELCIGGLGLARGYLKREELTNEKFVTNSYSELKGDRLYRSGDLARYLPDGNIEFLGRIDRQVKIRGQRVELGEIENLIMQNKSVQDSIVVVKENELEDKNIIAYIATKDDILTIENELRVLLQKKLPMYMIPSTLIFLDSLPINNNGKVDYDALPVPASIRLVSDGDFVAPRNQTEKELAKMWMRVLKLDNVSIQDNFLQLGGHSLNALKLISEIRDAFQIELPLNSLFENPTIEQLAEVIIKMQIQNISNDQLEEIFDELYNLSDEDVHKELAKN